MIKVYCKFQAGAKYIVLANQGLAHTVTSYSNSGVEVFSKWYFDKPRALRVFKSLAAQTIYKKADWFSTAHAKVTKHSMTAVRVPCISGSSKVIIHHEGN